MNKQKHRRKKIIILKYKIDEKDTADCIDFTFHKLPKRNNA